MLEVLRREAVYLWYFFSVQFEQIFGYWAAGMAVGSAVSVFGKERIHAAFAAMRGRRWGALGVVPASLIGAVSPLCMYGTIPVSASFAAQGMEEDWLAAFMMSSVLLNPQLLFYSAALGGAALAVRAASCLVCGCCAGLLVRFVFRERKFFRFDGFAEGASRDTEANLLLRFLFNLLRNVRATGAAFLLGVALSAVFQRYVPADAMAALFGSHRGFGLLMAATVGVPLYVCGGGTIPLLASWLDKGMSMGAAAAFMITGPAMKITNLGAVKIVLSIKGFVLYIAFSVLFALVTGLLVDLLLPM